MGIKKEVDAPIGLTPRKPQSLIEFLAASGGLVDDAGELASRGLTARQVRGAGKLVKPGGRTLDNAREMAAEAGYLDQEFGDAATAVANSTPDDLLKAIDDELSGKPRWSVQEQGEVIKTWQAHEAKVAAREQYRRLVDEIDSAIDALGIEHTLDDGILRRAARMAAEDGDDPIAALELALEEDYRLELDAPGTKAVADVNDPDFEIPFFPENAGAGPEARDDAGALGSERRPGDGGAPDGDGGQLQGAGGTEAEEAGLRQAGDTPEPGTPEAQETAALALTEARRPQSAQDAIGADIAAIDDLASTFSDPVDVALRATIDDGFAIYDQLDTLRTRVLRTENALKKKYGVRSVDALDDAPLTEQERNFLFYSTAPTDRESIQALVEMTQPIDFDDMAEVSTEMRLAARDLPDTTDVAQMLRKEQTAVGRLIFIGAAIGKRGLDPVAIIKDAVVAATKSLSDPNDAEFYARDLLRRIAQFTDGTADEARAPAAAPAALAAPARTETTAAGDQMLIEGVAPVTTRQRLEAEGAKPMRGGNAAPPAGGLFDLDARDQVDMWDVIPAARKTDGGMLYTSHADMVAEADRADFLGDLIASCRD